METNETYPEIITQTINAFVDRIEQVLLTRGIARAERTSICTEVETQIHLMIERKVESGSELSLELVKGIIESMDPPESYAAPLDTAAIESTSTSPSTAPSKTPKPSERNFGFAYLKTFLNTPKRTTPSVDWMAMAGVGAICIGVLLFQMALLSGRHGGEVFAVGSFFMIFAGAIASIVSFWRIRHSNGLLTGQKIASIGMIAVPFFLINALLCAFLFTTPIGYVVGAVLMLASLVYGNYWAVRKVIGWLGTYSVKVSNADVKPSEVRNDTTEVSSTILEAGA